ncbi:MAG: exonuclease domain-containing protein [Polyangiaceae bacterium]|nr:exonuclease domain-containing protein [Polyangiaceae bacterium]
MSSNTHYLVVDLEATCWEDGAIPRDQMEIIEIGAVLVDAGTLEPVRDLGAFVRPIRHRQLSDFCTRLTTITQAQVDAAPLFPVALRAVRELLRGTDSLFCSWGKYDRGQLERDAKRHGVPLPFGGRHLNLKEAFSKRLGESREYGVGQALRRVGLSFVGTQHRAIDDARNIARLLPYALGARAMPAGPPARDTRTRS